MISTQFNINEILFDLESSVEETRRNAILTLMNKMGKNSIPYLEKIAENDDSPSLRYLARKGILIIKKKYNIHIKSNNKNIESLEKTMESNDKEKIIELLKNIRENPPLKLYPLIKKILKNSTDTDIKFYAYLTLTKYGIVSDFKFAEIFLNTNTEKKLAIIKELSKFNSDTAYRYIILFITSDDDTVINEILKTLRNTNLSKLKNILHRMIEGLQETEQLSAIIMSGYLKEKGLDILEKAIKVTKSNKRLHNQLVEIINTFNILGVSGSNRLLELIGNKSSINPEKTFMFPKGELSGYIDNFKKIKRFEKGLFSKDISDEILEKIRKNIHSKDNNRIELALKDIIKHNAYEFINDILNILKTNKNDEIRAHCLKTLAYIGNNKFINIIAKGLRSRSPIVRKGAITALKIIGSDEAESLILTKIKDSHPEVRGAALLAIKDNPAIDLITPLKEMIFSNDRKMQEEAFYIMSNIKNNKVISLLQSLINHRDTFIAIKANNTLQIMAASGNILAKAAIEGINLGSFKIQ